MARRTVLLNPGPVNISERVRQALLRADICHREGEFSSLMASIRSRLCAAFAPSGYTAVLITGSGSAALEAALVSSVEPGRAILAVVNGVYGERIARMARVHGIRVVEVTTGWTEPPDLAQVEALLARDPGIQVVAMVHHETTTGLINPVAEVGSLTRAAGKSLLVDSISGLGGEALDLRAQRVDLCVGTANKCIQGVPGLAFVLVGHEEVARLAGIPPRSVYLNLPSHWEAQEKGDPLFTPAVQAAYALDEALAELLEETVAGRIARYGRAAALLREGFVRLGLSPLLPAPLRGNTITALELPQGVSYASLHDQLKAQGFVIYAGQGVLATRIFRVANMGDISLEEYRQFLTVLEAVLPLGGGHGPSPRASGSGAPVSALCSFEHGPCPRNRGRRFGTRSSLAEARLWRARAGGECTGTEPPSERRK
ncbi:MAG: pyridoxal-phosphate-dependent aminotransferase family protein [Candidatus Methylomirabilia bacterium]